MNPNANGEEDDIFVVFSKENLEKIILVVQEKHEDSTYQKHRLHLVPPSEQRQDATAEEKAAGTDLQALCKTKNPKIKFRLPPLFLRSGRLKTAGPGLPFKAKNAKQNEKQDEKKEEDMSKWSHTFWLIPGTEGLPQELLDAYGGAEQLYKTQLDAIALLREAQLAFERKRFFHPALLDEKTKQKKLEVARFTDPDVTMEKCLEGAFRIYISDHDNVRLTGNYANQDGNKLGPGVSLKSNAWYPPKDKPTAAQNEKVAQSYMNIAIKKKFDVNAQMLKGFRQGLRHRRVQCEARTTPTMWTPLPQHPDPMLSHARGGDLVSAKVELSIYDAASKGQSLTNHSMRIIYQPENQRMQPTAADPKLCHLPIFKERTKRQHYEDDDEEQEPKRRQIEVQPVVQGGEVSDIYNPDAQGDS